MKKKNFLIVSVLCFILVFATACEGAPSVKKVLNPKHYEGLTYDSVGMYSLSGEVTDISGNGLLAVIKNHNDGDTKYTVYDLPKMESVAVFTDDKDSQTTVTLGSRSKYFTAFINNLTEDDDDETVLCDGAGNVLKRADGNVAANGSLDLVEFDNTVFRINEDGIGSKVAEFSALNSGMPKFTDTNGKYYYVAESDVILVYNDKCRLISNYKYPAHALSAKSFVLDNGNFIVQYKVLLPSDTKKYSFVEGTSKYKLVTSIINPKNGKARSIKADFVIDRVMSRTATEYNGQWDFDFLASSIKNYAKVYPIVDGILSKTALNEKIYSMSNSGKLLYNIEKTFDNQRDTPQGLNDKYCSYRTVDWKQYLATYNGKTVGEISSFDKISENYLVKDNKIYNYNLELIYDAGKKQYYVEHLMDNCVILRGKDDVKIMTGTSANNLDFSTLISEEETDNKFIVSKSSEYFFLNNSNECEIYNDCGKKLMSSPYFEFVTLNLDDMTILRVFDEGTTYFYCLKCETKNN